MLRDLVCLQNPEQGKPPYNLLSKLSGGNTWRNICLFLGLEDFLNSIAVSTLSNEEKLIQVFKKWIDNGILLSNSDRYPYSWRGLHNILIDAEKASISIAYFSILDKCTQ